MIPFFKLFSYHHVRIVNLYSKYCTASDIFTVKFIQRQNETLCDSNVANEIKKTNTKSEEHFDLSHMTAKDLEEFIIKLQSKKKFTTVANVLSMCRDKNKSLTELTLKTLFRDYSSMGKVDMVEILKSYCSKVKPHLHEHNGEFAHYLARAQCMKGNSEKGLALLKECYLRNQNLRGLYRIIFRELIQDSVLNRSEASLVVFKRHVLEFSEEFADHYPLVCLWHICWASSWFSDQTLSNTLFDTSEQLREIVKDKATTLCVSILKNKNNEDAVLRLLQTFLKYKYMTEYTLTLETLFNYKLKNRDIRGCTEILKNCDVLGLKLPDYQRDRYIMLVINKTPEIERPCRNITENFKLKF